MRVTSFISGAAIGILAGMYVADRRSLTNLQNKLQVVGNVVQDVMGKATNNVMGGVAKMSHHAPKADAFNLDDVKALIDRNPEVKRKVDEILQGNGLAQKPSNLTDSKSATTAMTSTSTAAKAQTTQQLKSSTDEHQSAH